MSRRLLLVILSFIASPAIAAATCEDLAKLSLPNTTITLAQNVAAGAFTPPGGARGGNPFSSLPAFCRIQATLKPSSDSEIMVPAMGHGPGTNGDENFNYDALSVIEQWKQTGKAPEELIFDHYKNGTMVGKRLVCQYPKVPTYKSTGNTEEPASFVCK